MHPSSPKPLAQAEFYMLLALCRGDSHRYALKAIIFNDSRGGVALADSQVYRCVTKLHDEGNIDLVSKPSAGPMGISRQIYAISKIGTIRLQEEVQRLAHAVEIARHAGILQNNVPTDIQRILLAASETTPHV